MVDSIQVDLMAPYLNLLDVREETGETLVLVNSSIAYVLNPDVEILQKWTVPEMILKRFVRYKGSESLP